MMKSPVYNGIKNISYLPGRKIGQGGEGAVYEVQGNKTLVIKLYTDTPDFDKADKLLFMASIAAPALTDFAAWPLDVVRDSSARVWGFIMNKLEGFVPLHMLFSPMERKKLFPDKGYNFLVHVARNLAMAFHKIHEMGVVIGDVNEANILVNATGMISLIDCDSFQIRHGNRFHFCEVGIPRYTAPELLEKGSFINLVRTVSTDSFALATLIFQLLFLGRAPFTGINLTDEEIDEEKAIKRHEFAYSLDRKSKKLLPAKNSLQLNSLSPGVIISFHAAFEGERERPSPLQWVNDLDALSKEIISCSRAKIHYYPKALSECPWCLFREKAGILYFLDDSYLSPQTKLNDIEQFVNGFKLEKIELRKLSENYTTFNLSPNLVDNQFKSYKNLNRIILLTIVLSALALSLLYSWNMFFFGLLIALLFKLFSPTEKKLKNELLRRRDAYNYLKVQFRSMIRQQANQNDYNKYVQYGNRLIKVVTAYKNLQTDFLLAKKDIEEKHYNKKYYAFLAQFDVRHHTIASFGTSKKSLIYSNGIRTAADVIKLHTLKIAGIGPKNIQILFDWQRQIGSAFVYVPDIELIKREINTLENDIEHKKQKLAVDIKSEYKTMSVLKANVLSAADVLELQYTDTAKKLYQAELDLHEFQKLTRWLF